MEFTHGRRDRLYIIEEEEEEVGVSKHPSLIPSSSSASSSTAFRWNGGSTGGGGGGGGGDVDGFFVEKEHMFDKVVTPSDVGKLNRLVIPKQHAEKYFPLDTSANEKGLLLNFEDRTGKPWRFRYSYWNSSQSYVMTKGWSRFVKEKGLDAGDTVSFVRGVGEAGRQRLYIDWKRRPEIHEPPRISFPRLSFAQRPAAPWSDRIFVPSAAAWSHNWQGHAYSAPSSGAGGGQLLYYRSPAAMEVQQVGSSGVPMVLSSVPLLRNQAAVKRVRLFGVNLDCPESGGDANCHSNSLSVYGPQLHPRTPALPLLQPPHAAGKTVAGSSSSMCKEQHSPVDLYL